jgi:hypothetical protein
MRKINRLRTAVVVLAFCALFTVGGRADDAAPAGKPPVVIACVAVGSAAQVAKLSGDLGIPLPAILTPAGVEQMFPFLGQGGFNGDLPVACDFLVGPGLDDSKRALFFLPVNAGHALIKDFPTNGEKLGDDGAIVSGSPFRRVGDYLMFGGTPDVIQQLKPADLVAQLSDHPLLYLSYDSKRLRENAPELMESFKKGIVEGEGKPTSKTEAAGQQLAIHAMTDGLDKLVMRLDTTADALKFTTQIQPGPALVAKTVPIPTLPEGLCARVDVQLPAGWSKSGVEWIQKLVEDDKEIYADMNMTPAERAKAFAMVTDSLEALFGGEELTMGVGQHEKKVIFYSVSQSTAARNVHQDFQKVVDEINAIDAGEGKSSEVHLSQYADTAGEQVDRLIFDGEDGKTKVYIDCIDHGQLRLTTIALSSNGAIEKLLGCKLEGSLKVFASGWVDIRQTLDLAAMASRNQVELTESDHELLDKVFKGQRINWSVATGESLLNIGFDLPIAMVKSIILNAQPLADLGNRMSAKAGGN